jgi:hypothetical protein
MRAGAGLARREGGDDAERRQAGEALQRQQVVAGQVAQRADSSGPAACDKTCAGKRDAANRAEMRPAEIIRPGHRQEGQDRADAEPEHAGRQVACDAGARRASAGHRRSGSRRSRPAGKRIGSAAAAPRTATVATADIARRS